MPERPLERFLATGSEWSAAGRTSVWSWISVTVLSDPSEEAAVARAGNDGGPVR
jgi:hypothetical protein